MKPLEMGKDMKIKHNVSSPTKNVQGYFFLKKALNGETDYFQTNLQRELFYMGTNNQITQGGRKSFTNAFSSNLNTKPEKFPQLWGETHLKINPNQSIKLWKD